MSDERPPTDPDLDARHAPDGVVADGVVADGVVADGVVADGVVADDLEDSPPAEPDDLLARDTDPDLESAPSQEDEDDGDFDAFESDLLANDDRDVAHEPEPATTEPRRADLPTSWPEPIPVGAPAATPTRLEGMTITPPLVVLGSLLTLIFLLFVTIEPTPRWLLLFAAVIAVLGTDGALEQAWPRVFGRASDDADSTPYLFLPALAAIAWPLLIEHNVRGYLVLPAAMLAGGAFMVMLIAQLSSVRTAMTVYPLSRLVSTAAVYFTAFALFSLSYVLDVQLPAAILAVAVIAAMLSVELFREGQVDPLETLVFAGVTGIVLAEARWAMYYVPVGGYLAGLALLLGFFLITGLLHSHLTRRLSSIVALEYAGIAGAGVLLVSIAGQAGLG